MLWNDTKLVCPIKKHKPQICNWQNIQKSGLVYENLANYQSWQTDNAARMCLSNIIMMNPNFQLKLITAEVT